jgi:alkaline phosphatase
MYGSIEADIFLHNDSLIVGHTTADIPLRRTLENMYLRPLAKYVTDNHGHPYKDASRPLQLMIDVKTAGVPTLRKLVQVLEQFPALIHSGNLHVVISGNRPADSLFTSYPAFISFDGELSHHYSSAALTKIVMLSDDLKRYTRWDGKSALPPADYHRLDSLVQYAHGLHKTIRFWDAPDIADAWRTLEQLHVDYINTDHIPELAAFFREAKQ